MKQRLYPASSSLVILDPYSTPPGARVTMDGVVVDPRKPFWRRRLAERSMVADPPSTAKAPTTTPED